MTASGAKAALVRARVVMVQGIKSKLLSRAKAQGLHLGVVVDNAGEDREFDLRVVLRDCDFILGKEGAFKDFLGGLRSGCWNMVLGKAGRW